MGKPKEKLRKVEKWKKTFLLEVFLFFTSSNTVSWSSFVLQFIKTKGRRNLGVGQGIAYMPSFERVKGNRMWSPIALPPSTDYVLSYEKG